MCFGGWFWPPDESGGYRMVDVMEVGSILLPLLHHRSRGTNECNNRECSEKCVIIFCALRGMFRKVCHNFLRAARG